MRAVPQKSSPTKSVDESTEAERRNRRGVEKPGGGGWTPDRRFNGLRAVGTGCTSVEYIIYNNNNNYIINASNNDIMKRDGNTVFSASAVSDRVAVTKGKKPYNLSKINKIENPK